MGKRCNIVLQEGEICIHNEQITVEVIKNVVTGYTGGGGGVSVRVAKGLSVRNGASERKAIRNNVSNFYPGILSITNKRIVLSSEKASINCSFDKIGAVAPYKKEKAFSLQVGDKTFKILCKNPKKVCNLILNKGITNNSIGENNQIQEVEWLEGMNPVIALGLLIFAFPYMVAKCYVYSKKDTMEEDKKKKILMVGVILSIILYIMTHT